MCTSLNVIGLDGYRTRNAIENFRWDLQCKVVDAYVKITRLHRFAMTQDASPKSNDQAEETPRGPGYGADRPREIPPRGWFQILRRSFKAIKNDHLTLIAGGVAYAWFLALFPGMIAAVLIYGLVTDPAQVESQVNDMASGLPQDAQSLITTQLKSIAGGSGGLGLGLVLSLALALWSASAGMAGLVEAVNIAYEEEEERNFVVKRGLALLLTIGFLIFLAVAVGLVAVFPVVLSQLGTGPIVSILAQVVRWAVLVGAAILALGLIYRVGPDRNAASVRWLSTGSFIATILWIAVSVGFSFYVDNFGSYGKTYGALAGVVVLLIWFWITALAVLIGAKINAESEGQTIKDTTTGEPKPIGSRGAVKADQLPPTQ
jgi:membrane protein